MNSTIHGQSGQSPGGNAMALLQSALSVHERFARADPASLTEADREQWAAAAKMIADSSDELGHFDGDVIRLLGIMEIEIGGADQLSMAELVTAGGLVLLPSATRTFSGFAGDGA